MMNINSIGNQDNSQRQTQSSGMGKEQLNDSVTKEIQTKLQGEEQKLKDLSYNDEMSVEEKSKKRKEIRKEISELNRELRQHQIELQREKQQKIKEASKEEKKIPGEENAQRQNIDVKEDNIEKEDNMEKGELGLSTVRMKTMLSASAGLERTEVQSNVVMNMGHQVNVLEAEIQQDKARGQNVDVKEEWKEELENIVLGSNASRTDNLNKVNKELEELVKEEYKDEKKGAVKLQEIQEEQEKRRKRIRVIID